MVRLLWHVTRMCFSWRVWNVLEKPIYIVAKKGEEKKVSGKTGGAIQVVWPVSGPQAARPRGRSIEKSAILLQYK